MITAVLLLAAATPAPAKLTPLERQDCKTDCRFEALVLPGRFVPGNVFAPVADGDGAPVCLANPVPINLKAAGTDTVMQGVLTSLTLRQGTQDRQVPVFLTLEAPGSGPVRIGQLCGARLSAADFGSGWKPAETVQITLPTTRGTGESTRASAGFGSFLGGLNASKNRYESFSLRSAGEAIGAAYGRLKQAVPDAADLSPSQWLFKRDSAASRQLLLRSSPKGARVLLGGADLGLATDTPIAVDRATFDAIVLAAGKVKRPLSRCKVTPLADATADALVECDLKGQ